jgi:hypothetical protein
MLMISVAAVKYPIFERQQPTRCLSPKAGDNTLNGSSKLNFLVYPDKSLHSVRIPYPGWTSARVVANIFYILYHEVMKYSVVLVDTTTIFSEHPVNYAAGCLDPDDGECVERDPNNPIVHFTFETWSGGGNRAVTLPQDVRPTLISVLDYSLVDQWYLWQDIIDNGLQSEDHLSLDYYRSYDASNFKPHKFFDPWTRVFELVPDEVIVRCTQKTANSPQPRITDDYIRFTNDTVWFSPACRDNPSECLPVIIQYSVSFTMQVAYFLRMPLAVIMVGPGRGGAYSEYYSAIRGGRFLFGWYQPDDTLRDAHGNQPVIRRIPIYIYIYVYIYIYIYIILHLLSLTHSPLCRIPPHLSHPFPAPSPHAPSFLPPRGGGGGGARAGPAGRERAGE